MKILILIIIASLTNMAADLFLVSGRDYNNAEQTRIGLIKATPDKHLIISGRLGFLAISMWFTPLYYLRMIPGDLGYIAMLTFVIMITCFATFHVLCSYTFMLAKRDENNLSVYMKKLGFYGILCGLSTVFFSLIMIYLGVKNIIQMSVLNYICLPFFSVFLIQFILGRLVLKDLKYFRSFSGTFAIMISLISLITIFI